MIPKLSFIENVRNRKLIGQYEASFDQSTALKIDKHRCVRYEYIHNTVLALQSYLWLVHFFRKISNRDAQELRGFGF